METHIGQEGRDRGSGQGLGRSRVGDVRMGLEVEVRMRSGSENELLSAEASALGSAETDTVCDWLYDTFYTRWLTHF